MFWLLSLFLVFVSNSSAGMISGGPVGSAALASSVSSGGVDFSTITTALNLKAPLASPTLTGTVSATGAGGISVTYGISAATITTTGLITASSFTATGAASFATASGNVGVGTASPDTLFTVGVKPTSGGTSVTMGSIYSAADGNSFQISRGGIANPMTGLFNANQASGSFDIQATHSGVGQADLTLNAAGGSTRIQTSAGTQLYYCTAGTATGMMKRGDGTDATLCTASTALGIYVP